MSTPLPRPKGGKKKTREKIREASRISLKATVSGVARMATGWNTAKEGSSVGVATVGMQELNRTLREHIAANAEKIRELGFKTPTLTFQNGDV